MKTIKFLALSLFLFTVSAHAQITKGNWMVGGDANFSNSKVKDENGDIIASGNSISINPNIGYFFLDKFAAGLKVNLNYYKPSGGLSSSGYGGSPFVRYYFLKPEKTVNVLAEISYGYSISKVEGQKSQYSSGYNLKVGPAIYFNSSVALEITANYQSRYLESSKSDYSNFIIGVGFQIHLEKDK